MAEFELTIQILQGDDPIFTKPKLAEKYLLKPPFRFLHDVISAVQAGTGFAPGLYSGDELDAKAIQDKEQKVAFLGKMIDVVSIVAGQAVPAKPLKIVAGLEPENTNIFLQMLGRACRQSNGADAVAQVLNGGGGEVDPPAASHPPAAAPEAATPAEEKKKRSSKDGGRRAKPPVEEPPAPDNEEAPPPKLKSKSRSKPPPAEDAAPPDPPARAASPAENQDAMNSSQGARVLARPQSARKAPPKLPSSNTASASLVAGVRSSGAGAGRRAPGNPGGAAAGAANKPVALFEEGAADNSDDDVEVVHEARSVALGPRGEDGAEKGVLVKDILEAEEELKKAGAEAAVDENEEPQNTGIILKRKGSMARGGGAGAAAHAAGASHPIKANDLQGIRELVQRLCQSSNPLAKSMDYLAEDIENMSKEYRFWVTERRVFQERLDEEQRLGTNKEKHDAQLADLDSQVKQVQDRIVGVKGSILRNDETINNLLGMAVGK